MSWRQAVTAAASRTRRTPRRSWVFPEALRKAFLGALEI
jgi:hypothetical protein